jgi:hypothetical protein
MMLSMVAIAKDKAGSKSGSWNGTITDAKCASGANAKDAACAKKCIGGGEKAVFLTDKDGKVIAIHNQDAIAGHEGHHVKVSGSIMEDGQLHVDKVAMLPEKGDKKDASKM